jgi:hypothetical protein
MQKSQAAQLLGMKESEIVDVRKEDGDDVITCFDRTQVVVLIEPDGAGVTGLAFYQRPDGRDVNDPEAPALVWPVFTPRPADVEDDDEPEEKPARGRGAAKKDDDAAKDDGAGA